jgi:hypothetical protein
MVEEGLESGSLDCTNKLRCCSAALGHDVTALPMMATRTLKSKATAGKIFVGSAAEGFLYVPHLFSSRHHLLEHKPFL